MPVESQKQFFIKAFQQLSNDSYANVVDLLLAVPGERKGKSPLRRVITGGGKNGYRTPERPNHNGIDFSGGASANGWHPYINFLAEGAEITRAELAGTYGNVVDLSAKIPYRYKGKADIGVIMVRRAHCHSIQAKKGDKVPLWGAYALMGTTGNSTAPHEHFEVWVNGKRVNPHDVEIHVPFMSSQETYIVQPGDTYYKISQMFGVSVANLREWNGWPDKEIPIGAKMWLVPPPKDAPEPEPPVRPEEPPYSEASPEEYEVLLADLTALSARVDEIEKRMEAMKQALL